MFFENVVDQSSRLKQFQWEELDDDFFIAVIFRENRRYVSQQHFEEQLSFVQSPAIEEKWRRSLFEVISQRVSTICVTAEEMKLINEISSWHLNSSHNFRKFRDQLDYLIDFEDFLDVSQSIVANQFPLSKRFCLHPVRTLTATSKNIEMLKNHQANTNETHSNSIMEKSERKKNKVETVDQSVHQILSATAGWLQIDGKIVPFVKEQCDRLMPVEYLLKENLISPIDDQNLRSFYIPIDNSDVKLLNNLLDQISPKKSHFILSEQSLLITLDHFLFRLKRLFFIRFLSTPVALHSIDHRQVMGLTGGLITFKNQSQRIPFVYINNEKYIPRTDFCQNESSATFCMATDLENEYLRVVAYYDYLSSEENNDYLNRLLSIRNLMLIPVVGFYDENRFSIMSFIDFHYNEYVRRRKQQRAYLPIDEPSALMLNGWWQPPKSAKRQSSISHLKQQRSVFF